MMGYYGNGSYSLFGLVGFLFWTVLFVDLVLVGIWLWRQLDKKK
ncbi:MAG: hypothetical protein AAB443_00685 [Patescibacteria group bacterium]